MEKDISIDLLEQETLLEIGNIIVGACVGEIANILKDMVRFSPPEFFVQSGAQIAKSSLFEDNQFVLSFKTKFKLEEQDGFTPKMVEDRLPRMHWINLTGGELVYSKYGHRIRCGCSIFWHKES